MANAMINRRDFLLLRVGGDEVAELSCERLFMRFVDGLAEGNTTRLFDALADDLKRTRTVRLTDVSWLAREDLRVPVDALLEGFRAGGGKVVYEEQDTKGKPRRREGHEG